MNIANLTFGQLLRLSHSNTLCRVTAAYHRALRAAWEKDCGETIHFLVRDAKEAYPSIVRRYKPVLSFLRGKELKRATRLSADAQRIPILPGANREFTSLRVYEGQDPKPTLLLAALIVRFCEQSGVPAQISVRQRDLVVHVATNEFGAMLLRYRTGQPVEYIRSYCGVEFRHIFWWLPPTLVPGTRLNPCLKCLNTPDYLDHAREILFEP
jgi:hypothetical protein